jgi:hypothetical protein
LSERDEEGRRVIFVQTRKMNSKMYSPVDATRLLTYLVSVLLEEEETQIAGIVLIYDNASLTLKHLLSPLDAKEYMHFFNSCALTRQKGVYIMNLPPIANFFLELIKSLISEKLRKRLFVLKRSDDLKNYINPALLPKEYGGTRCEADMMQDFLELREKHLGKLLKFLEYKVDWSKVPREKIWPNQQNDTVGSFRKLEID